MLHEMGFPVVLKPFEGDWYDAANLYREWVLPNADWVKNGRLDERNNTPAWAYNLTTWLTPFLPSHENYDNIIEIANRLQLDKDALAVHVYNWDYLGHAPGNNRSDDLVPWWEEDCEDMHGQLNAVGAKQPCGFDTHYPDYLPARRGFDKYINKWHDMGMRVVPYVNGHLVDVGSHEWKPELAQLAAIK